LNNLKEHLFEHLCQKVHAIVLSKEQQHKEWKPKTIVKTCRSVKKSLSLCHNYQKTIYEYQ
jgi:hypothetical protein